jgi:hypothetical protein
MSFWTPIYVNFDFHMYINLFIFNCAVTGGNIEKRLVGFVCELKRISVASNRLYS